MHEFATQLLHGPVSEELSLAVKLIQLIRLTKEVLETQRVDSTPFNIIFPVSDAVHDASLSITCFPCFSLPSKARVLLRI
jgi:hypothetical protein